jgi:hypothetical protein
VLQDMAQAPSREREDMAQAPSRERERALEASTDIFGGGIE